MDTVEILEKARELISVESRWTQGSYAKDGNGEGTFPWGEDAVCFCALGAIKKAGDFRNDCSEPALFLGRVLRDRTGFVSIDEYNDSHSHADILSLFDHAIAAAREA